MLWIACLAASFLRSTNADAGSKPASTAAAIAGQELPPGVHLAWTKPELELLEAADQGRVDQRWLLAAALAASGEQNEDGLRHIRRIERASARLRTELADQHKSQHRAAAILEFLYGELLSGSYQADATDLADALDGRGYNCVSATVLFNYLAEECGLKAAAVELPGHVFSVIETDAGEFDVETTCRDWFRLAERAGPTRRPGARRKLTAQGLAALVYYNRGVDLLARHRFAEAIAANLKALRCDPTNAAARSNWLAGQNNWALELHEQGRYADSVRLLRHGLQAAPEHRPFLINFVAVHQRWIEALLEQRQYESALEALRLAQRDLPQEPYFAAAAARIQQQTRGAAPAEATASEAWSVMLHERQLQAAGSR